MQKINNLFVTLTIIGIFGLFILQIRLNSNKRNERTMDEISSKSNDWNTFLEFLSENNVFLADIEKLNEIKTFTSSSWIQMNFDKFGSKKDIISFGIMNEDINSLLNVILLLQFNLLRYFNF